MQSRLFRKIRGVFPPLALVSCLFVINSLAAGALLPRTGGAHVQPRQSKGLTVPSGSQWITISSHFHSAERGAWLQLFSKVVAGPFGEELVARGALFPVLVRIGGSWPAAILSSLVDGFLHVGGPGRDCRLFIFHTVSALLRCTIYMLTGKLRWCMLYHALWNTRAMFFWIAIPRWGVGF